MKWGFHNINAYLVLFVLWSLSIIQVAKFVAEIKIKNIKLERRFFVIYKVQLSE